MFRKILLLLLLFPLFIEAQTGIDKPKTEPLSRILFVFDGSQSMFGKWQSDVKINIAKKLMSNLIDSLATFDNLQIALRLYGHQKQYPPADCNDTKLEVPFADNNYEKVKNRIQSITPKGTTPLAFALEQSAGDFPPCDNCRNIIILITDGIEECGGDPCAASAALQKNGIAMKPFIIGIGRDFKDAFNCVGVYFDASSETAFQKALNSVVSQALNSTTLQVNLLDINNKATETNVNMTFYDHTTGKVKYNFIHTMNNLGLPDTLVIDPMLTYDLVVNTLPAVSLDSISLVPGAHVTVSLSAPQGYLNLKIGANERIVKNLQAVVKQQGKCQTLNVQSFGESKKYLCGTYDLEILTLPRLYISDVKISQSKTTTIDIPLPGIVVIRKSVNGFGSLYLEKNNTLQWIYDLRENVLQETLVLQPGNYKVVFRSRNSERALYTIDNSFTILPGGTSNVNLFSY
ncbi:MAG: VWA domain-containing protein [Bacteroidales bacterium]|nr:VWA domain-containing protein [Bacteroidales bacterium]MBK9358390.1 VWA domain-containing protein [Bacteroidales bacterium]